MWEHLQKQARCSLHTAAWLWNQCSHVMSSLIIVMTSWKSDLPPAQFAMQGLSIALQQQCTRGYTRGGVWPLESRNITNPRRTFLHRASPAPLVQKRDEWWAKQHRPDPVCVAPNRGRIRRQCATENAALWHIVRYRRLDISAVICSQCAL